MVRETQQSEFQQQVKLPPGNKGGGRKCFDLDWVFRPMIVKMTAFSVLSVVVVGNKMLSHQHFTSDEAPKAVVHTLSATVRTPCFLRLLPLGLGHRSISA